MLLCSEFLDLGCCLDRLTSNGGRRRLWLRALLSGLALGDSLDCVRRLWDGHWGAILGGRFGRLGVREVVASVHDHDAPTTGLGPGGLALVSWPAEKGHCAGASEVGCWPDELIHFKMLRWSCCPSRVL